MLSHLQERVLYHMIWWHLCRMQLSLAWHRLSQPSSLTLAEIRRDYLLYAPLVHETNICPHDPSQGCTKTSAKGNGKPVESFATPFTNKLQ